MRKGKPKDVTRIWIEGISPAVNGARYAIKKTVGESVDVTAHIFTEGHDKLSAALLYRTVDEPEWRETSLTSPWNDEWYGSFPIESYSNYVYTVAAWIDTFTTWRNGVEKKVNAGQDVASDLFEGAETILSSAKLAPTNDAKLLNQFANQLRSGASGSKLLGLVLDSELLSLMQAYPVRRCFKQYEQEFIVRVDRERARFSAWYEMFPRSGGNDPERSATFREAATRLPEIAKMGFDVLYLPPIHPIGETKRKGRNNSLACGPSDPGSPWAIGNKMGGHKAVDPGLGTLDDFRWFVASARKHNLEVALDIAFQCSPDHPYVREHPEWFRHRPDGSIHYAENPPKKYEDIYPFNFECAEWFELWKELKNVFEFWINQGVNIFRVDNPHTKPFAFWEWTIEELQAEYPDTIFLSEAFTRPKVMYALAKLGFTQSYTYFTWRNGKQELTDYLNELTRSEVREYFRPNFFANTPDILHEFLQLGGRAAFQLRLVLAATLSSNYGIYSGFELCEHEAVAGTEEYLNSEKYQIKIRDWDAPGNIKEFIAQVNSLRRANRALQFTNNLTFLNVSNPHIIAYGKVAPDGADRVITVVNLNPHEPQEGTVTVPLEELGLPHDRSFQVKDLLSNNSYQWGRDNYVRLDPRNCPAHIFEIG